MVRSENKLHHLTTNHKYFAIATHNYYLQ